MKLNKKAIIIIAVILLVALLIPISYASIRILHANAVAKGRFVQYDACKVELQIVVDFLLEKYNETEKKPVFLTLSGSDRLVDPASGFACPDSLTFAISTIRSKGFINKDAPWQRIRFDEENILFESKNGNYALVYAPKAAPTYLQSPNENYRVLVEHIEGHWYHISKLY